MLPLLPEVNAVDHSVDRVVANIWVQLPDEWMHLGRAEWSLCEQEQDRIGKNGVRRLALRTLP